jgi:hypothetical protein
MWPHSEVTESSYERFGVRTSGWTYLAAVVIAAMLISGCATGFNWRKQSSGSGSTGPFTIGGNVLGLTGTGLVLQDNGGDNLTINANGPFTFATAVASGYLVTVKTQPTNPAQTCSVTDGTGTTTANVTSVEVVCGVIFTVGGSITGLDGSGMVLQNNGGDNLHVSGTGNVNFTFATPLIPGSAYDVTILTQPSSPSQVCTVANASGTISENVTNVEISCSQPKYTIGGSVVGLIQGTGDTLELQDNGGDNLLVTGDTNFTFPTPITYGGLFNVQIFLPPTSQPQPCNEFGYTGIATGNVSGVLVDCQHNDWDWISFTIPSTNSADNLAAVTTPLFPAGQQQAPDFGTPGARAFPATWTDARGNKWLFGGEGFPYPNSSVSNGQVLPGLLNDLWVYIPSLQESTCLGYGAYTCGGWVPANLSILNPAVGVYTVNTAPLQNQNASGVYGALGVSSGGAPGARWGSSTWTDGSGNLWMFGGQGYDSGAEDFSLLNDIWEWIPTPPPGGLDPLGAGTFTGQWIWQGGSNVGSTTLTPLGQGAAAKYGTQGVPSTTNIPGGRWASATFTDSAGNVWLFGGQGVDSTGHIVLLNDLWEYNIAGRTWTWVSGSTVGNENGVYGALGTPAGTNYPGGRQNAVLWVDGSGKVWLFGGFGFDANGTGAPLGATLNDLWEFSGGQWTWVSGDNIANQNGTYGIQTLPAATNVPGSRWGAEGWTDASNNLWFFGGWGYGSVTSHPQGYLNDIWEYQHSTGQWIWWKGSNDVSQVGQYLNNEGMAYVLNVVGGRRGAAVWPPDPQGCLTDGVECYVLVFGGDGFDSTASSSPGYLNDFWTYLPFP